MAQQPPTANQAGGTNPSPWPARIVGIIIIVAIIAIGLSVFLPRERQEQQPQMITQVDQNQVPTEQNPQSTDQAPQPTPDQQPQQEQPVPQPMPNAQQQTQQTQQAQQQAAQQANQSSARTWQAPQQQQTSDNSQSPTARPIRQQRAAQQAAAPADQSAQQQQQATQPRQSASRNQATFRRPAPAQSTQAARQPTPAPSPAPTPAPRARQRQQAAPRPIMSPQQAQNVVKQAEGIERSQRWGALRSFIAMLRQKEYQDPENWEILQAAMATTGLSMLPGGATQGTGEILAVITNSRNGAEAAAKLERMGHQSAIPLAVQRMIVQVLATATDYQSAIGGLDRVLKTSNTQLSAQTVQNLQQAAAQAAQRQAQSM